LVSNVENRKNVGMMERRSRAIGGYRTGWLAIMKRESVSRARTQEARLQQVVGAGSFRIATQTLDDLRILIPSDHAGSLSARWEAGNFGDSVRSHFKVTFNYRSELMHLEP
jgi:hypothetical protein